MRAAFAITSLLAVGVLGLGPGAWAQRAFYVSATTAHDGNPYALHGAPAAWTTALAAGVSRGGRPSLGYDAQYAHYGQIDDFDSYWHRAYVAVGGDTLQAGLVAEQRLMVAGGPYGYVGGRAYGAYQRMVGGGLMAAQVTAEAYRFSELPERTRGAIAGALRASRSFATGTTLIGTAGAGYTAYPQAADAAGAPAAAPTPAVGHIEGGLRLAQSLTPLTGLAVQAQASALRTRAFDAYTMAPGASYALLDDPALYAVQALGAELTRLLFHQRVTVQAAAYRTVRAYAAQGLYATPDAYDPARHRRDVHGTAWVTATWHLRRGVRRTDVSLSGQWTDNRSNSYWFAYAGAYAGLRVAHTF